MPRPTPRQDKHTPPVKVQYEVVSPIWLVKAIAVTIVAALFCGYLTFCLLFYQGQWQLILHPTRTSSAPTSIAGIPYQLVHFGPDESATPQLTGWWIPAAPGARYANTTILFLPGSEGSLTNSITTLTSLHNVGLNIFAFDYRGYGQSAPTHPSQLNMTRDVDSAWQYLTTSRAIPAQQIHHAAKRTVPTDGHRRHRRPVYAGGRHIGGSFQNRSNPQTRSSKILVQTAGDDAAAPATGDGVGKY